MAKTERADGGSGLSQHAAMASSGLAGRRHRLSPKPTVFVMKATYVDGVIASAELSTPMPAYLFASNGEIHA